MISSVLKCWIGHPGTTTMVMLCRTNFGSAMRLAARSFALAGILMTKFRFRTCIQSVSTLRPKLNGRYFTYNIFKFKFWQKFFWFKFHCSLFPRVQLRICHRWYREWLVTCSAIVKPLLGPMVTQFAQFTYVWHLASTSKKRSLWCDSKTNQRFSKAIVW